MASFWAAEWINLDDLIESSSKVSPPRSGHVSFHLPKKDNESNDDVNDGDDKEDDIFIFGGYAEESAAKRFPVNDLWKWDNSKSSWNLVHPSSTSSSLPEQRLTAAAASVIETEDKKKIQSGAAYVFGGWDPQQADPGGAILQDIYKFELENESSSSSSSWTKIDTTFDAPTCRHVAVALSENTILIHTDQCSGNEEIGQHVLLLVVPSSDSDDGNDQGPTLVHQTTSGIGPSSRGLHSAVKLPGQNKVVVFGGATSVDGSMSNEVFCLDVDTWKWTPIEIQDPSASGGDHRANKDDAKTCPTPRASACFCALDSSTCVLFGGADRCPDTNGLRGLNDLWILQILDDENNEKNKTSTSVASWKQLDMTSTTTPPGRNAATLSPLKRAPSAIRQSQSGTGSESSFYFLLSGGWEPFRTTYNDNFILKLHKIQ